MQILTPFSYFFFFKVLLCYLRKILGRDQRDSLLQKPIQISPITNTSSTSRSRTNDDAQSSTVVAVVIVIVVVILLLSASIDEATTTKSTTTGGEGNEKACFFCYVVVALATFVVVVAPRVFCIQTRLRVMVYTQTRIRLVVVSMADWLGLLEGTFGYGL